MTDFEALEAAEKATLAKAERLYKLTLYAVGLTVGAAVIAILLIILARCCGNTPQSQMAIICQQLLSNSKTRGDR